MRVPERVTVVADTREKRYMTFPNGMWYERDGKSDYVSITPADATLEWGDYVLRGYEHITACERKGSWSEVFQNTCTRDGKRFHRCVDRLCERTLHPILFLDFPIHPISRVSGPDAWKAYHRLCRMCYQKKIQILWFPCKKGDVRIRAGEAVLGMMWTFILEHLKQGA